MNTTYLSEDKCPLYRIYESSCFKCYTLVRVCVPLRCFGGVVYPSMPLVDEEGVVTSIDLN